MVCRAAIGGYWAGLHQDSEHGAQDADVAAGEPQVPGVLLPASAPLRPLDRWPRRLRRLRAAKLIC